MPSEAINLFFVLAHCSENISLLSIAGREKCTSDPTAACKAHANLPLQSENNEHQLSRCTPWDSTCNRAVRENLSPMADQSTALVSNMLLIFFIGNWQATVQKFFTDSTST